MNVTEESSLSDPSERVLSLERAVKWREGLRQESKKLVLTNGCFDILHRGHAHYLWKARALGDALLVLQNADRSVKQLKGEKRPYVQEQHRAYLLASIRYVDRVVLFKEVRCHDEIAALAPDIYVKGGDYRYEDLNEQERNALDACGASFHFMPFIHGFSTSEIIQTIQLKE